MAKIFRIGIVVCYFFSVSLFAANLTAIKVDETKIILTRDEVQDVRIFSLRHPDRLVMDFKDTHLRTNLQKITLPKKSPILKVREGYPQKGVLRIVLDLSGPVRYKKLDESKILSVQVISKVPWIPRSSRGTTGNNSTSGAAPIAGSIDATLKAASPTASTSRDSIVGSIDKTLHDAISLKSTVKTKKLIIVIDPGHGGKDPGAIGDHGTKEKDVVLAIAQKLMQHINQNPGMHAVLTRDGDYYISLKKRLLLARKNKADLFVAIHADSYFNTRATGASVYSLSEHGASSIAARWLASRENHSELGGVDLGELEDQSYLLRAVLIDLAQTQTTKDSMLWGTSILRSLDTVTRLHYAKVERAPFLVLKSPDIPSLLVETGFLSNNKEEKRLRDPSHQNRIALALYNGIRGYRVIE